MTSNSFMPSTDGGKADLLDHVASTLPHYAALLEVTIEDLASFQADALAFRYTLKSLVDMQAYAHHWTEFKNLLRDGGAGSADWVVAPMLVEPMPAAVSPGIIPRLSTLVAHLKSHKNYTSAIGLDLGLIGTTTVEDPSTWKPILTAQNKAGHPIIACRKCWRCAGWSGDGSHHEATAQHPRDHHVRHLCWIAIGHHLLGGWPHQVGF